MNYLVRDNQAVSVESLNIAGMRRTRMAQSIYDASWGLLLRLMDEKAPPTSAKSSTSTDTPPPPEHTACADA